MNLTPSWPLEEGSEVQIRGLWRIPLPDGKYPGSVMEKLLDQDVWLLREGFTRIESCPRKIRELNEWKRQRGGRKVDPNKPNPREYLKHDDAIQYATTSKSSS